MQKKQNASITFPAALGGMNNILPADTIGQTQATLLENVTYDEITKTFKGSHTFNQVTNTYNGTLNKIYEVQYSGKRCIFVTHNNGFYDVTNNKQVDLIDNISDMIYNDNGVYIASGSNIYRYYNDILEEVPFKSFFLKSVYKAQSWAFRNIEYKSGRLYFTSWWAYNSEANASISGLGYTSLTGEQSEEQTNNIVMIYKSQNFTAYQGAALLKDDEGVYIYKPSNRSASDIPSDTLNVGIYKITGNTVEYDAARNLILYIVANDWNYKKNFGSINDESAYLTSISYSADGTSLGGTAKLITLKNKTKDITVYKGKSLYNAYYFDITVMYNRKIYPAFCTIDITIISYTHTTGGEFSCDFYIRLYINVGDLRELTTGITKKLTGVIFTNNERQNFFFKVFKTSNGSIVVFARDEVFFYDNSIDQTLNPTLKSFPVTFLTDKSKISDVCQNGDKFYITFDDGTGVFKVGELDFRARGDIIPFLLVNNGRLIASQTNSLYYSGIGDFNNWQEETDADALFLEIGYKDGGNIIAGALTYGSIIVFKDNGYIYRIYGDYPNWSVVKIAETDSITSNIYNMGGIIIFGTKTGVKQINPTQVYGDFLLSDFQNNIIANEVTSISESQERKTIVFCSKDYVFEYHINLKIFYVYQSEMYNQLIEHFKDDVYNHYALKDKSLFQQSNTLNNVTVQRALIHNQYNIVIKAITLYTDTLQEDTEIEIEFYKDKKVTRTLKAGQSKHKFFITVRLKELQLKYKHNGSIFINNIVIELMNVGA